MQIPNKAYEVVIAGAGPAGATASFFLSKAGIPHLLIDPSEFPRDKICGDAISGKSMDVLRKMDPSFIEEMRHNPADYLPTWGILFGAPGSKKLEVPFKLKRDENTPPVGYVSQRVAFDNFLFEKTESTFCDRHCGWKLTGIQRLQTGLRLTLSHTSGATTEVFTRMLLGAEGERSLTAKQLAGYVKEKKHYAAGLRQYWEGVEGFHADNYIELHFFKNIQPGYFWIFPLPNGKANVGIGMRSDRVADKKVDLKKALKAAIEDNPEMKARFANAKPMETTKGWGLPMGSKKRPLSGDNFLLLGDAASLIDPFTGEGIGNGMKSGMLAAFAVEKALKSDKLDAAFLKEAYDQPVYRALWDELKLSTFLQKCLDYPWLFDFVVKKAERNPTLKETITCMFDDLDIRDRLRSPSFYLKLLFR